MRENAPTQPAQLGWLKVYGITASVLTKDLPTFSIKGDHGLVCMKADCTFDPPSCCQGATCWIWRRRLGSRISILGRESVCDQRRDIAAS